MTQTLLVDQLIISYHLFTGTSDHVLLFLHGRGRKKEDWESYFWALEKNQISFLALDFPGFGGSELPKEIRGVQEYSAFVLQALDKLDIRQPVEIVAHSFGGRIAFYLAANFPEKVKKLRLIAPGGVEKEISKTKKWMFSIGKTLLPQKAQQQLKHRISSSDYQNAGKLEPIFKKVVNEDLRMLFPQITQPVRLYRWEQDDQIEQRQIKIMEEGLPNVTLKTFPNLGHDLHQEKAEEVLSDILAK